MSLITGIRAWLGTPGGHRRSTDPGAETRRRTIRRAMWIGIWVWPAFTLLDVWMCFVAYPGAPLGLFLVYRVLGSLLFFGAYRASFRPEFPLDRLTYLSDLSFGVAAAGIALMAVHLDGIRSPYMHGISIVALVRATVVPEPWRRALPTFTRIGLAFPLVIGLGAALSPEMRADWLTAAGLTSFANNFVFVLASSFLGMVSGHIVWSAQQQVYQARRIGRYRLQALIGQGGMGEVWLAWDLTLRRNVALKILRLTSGSAEPLVERFEREAQAASRLTGPYTVRVFDFGVSDDGICFIAMEYLAGQDLQSLVDGEGPLEPARAIRFVRQACASLAEAHAAGIIHRDIKPQNLFVVQPEPGQQEIKLLDFGIARFRAPGQSQPQLTRTGALPGTPAYMAPELWRGTPADERSDIYAVGVTLHFLLTGRTPFSDRSTMGMVWAQVSGMPTPVDAIGLGGPEGLEAVIRRCLAERPEDRYLSVTDLDDALAALSATGAAGSAGTPAPPRSPSGSAAPRSS